MNAREWIAGTLQLTDADLVPVPRAVLVELAASEPPADGGTAPWLALRPLGARFNRSRTWAYDAVQRGDFGPVGEPGGPFLFGRDLVVPLAQVEAYERRRVEEAAPRAPAGVTPIRRTAGPLSLDAERAARKKGRAA